MVHLTHQRGELRCVRRHNNPDFQLSTRLEMGGLKRTVTAHLRVIAAVSWKLADRLMRLPPGKPYVVGNLFTFSTLEKAVDLILATSSSKRRLLTTSAICSHHGGPQRSLSASPESILIG